MRPACVSLLKKKKKKKKKKGGKKKKGAIQQTGPRGSPRTAVNTESEHGEIDRGRTAVPDASPTDIEAAKLCAMSIQDIGAHHVQGDVALLAGPGDLGGAVAAIGGHPVAHWQSLQ